MTASSALTHTRRATLPAFNERLHSHTEEKLGACTMDESQRGAFAHGREQDLLQQAETQCSTDTRFPLGLKTINKQVQSNQNADLDANAPINAHLFASGIFYEFVAQRSQIQAPGGPSTISTRKTRALFSSRSVHIRVFESSVSLAVLFLLSVDSVSAQPVFRWLGYVA